MRIVKLLFPIFFIAVMPACDSASDSTSDTSSAFPSDLAVASPTDTIEDTASSSTSARVSFVTGSIVPRYTWATTRIDQLLEGATPTVCQDFDASLFLVQAENADCYGPEMAYLGHPDGTPSSGTLPTGDLGIWTAEDSATGHACSAAELNARMRGLSNQSFAAFTGLASMICVMNDNGIALPSASSVDLTTEMNALGIADTTFNSATLSENGSGQYDYVLDVTYASTDIIVNMSHIPGTTGADYQGRISYLVDMTYPSENCPGGEVTLNGSILYDRDSETEMALEMRIAYFCEHGTDGRTDGLVDLSQEYDASSNPTGWTDDASFLIANYDPTTLSGDYVYNWQAGYFDGQSRVFNLSVDGSEDTAVSFYGYDDDIASADGNIAGFICNWAGPGADHTLQDFAQYQTVTYDETTGTYTASTSNVGYAPINACSYDGTGSLSYDSDIDGAVDTDPTVAVANDLLPLTDADADDIFDEIEASGFALPTAPANF